MKNRIRAKQDAENELRILGFQFSYLTDAYQRPNLFYSEESKWDDDEKFNNFKLFRSRNGKRFIVAKDGTMYYLTN